MASNELSFTARKAVAMESYALPTKASGSAMPPPYLAPLLSPPSLPHCQLATRQLPPLLPPPHSRASAMADHSFYWPEPPPSSMSTRQLFRAAVPYRGPRAGSVPSGPPAVAGCSTSAGIPLNRSVGNRTCDAYRHAVTHSSSERLASASRSPLLAMSKHQHHPEECQESDRHNIDHRKSCQEQQHCALVPRESEAKAKAESTSAEGAREEKKPGTLDGSLIVEEVEIFEFSNDDIAGPINQKPLTVPQDASLDFMHEDLLPPAALPVGVLDFPYDWSTFSSQNLDLDSLKSPGGKLSMVASRESLQDGVGSPVSVLRRQGSSPGSAATSLVSSKPLDNVHTSNDLQSADLHMSELHSKDLHLGSPRRVLLYPDFGHGEGDDFCEVMEEEEMWAALSPSSDSPDGWLSAACLVLHWPKAPRSKRRRVTVEASSGHAGAPSSSAGAATCDHGKGREELTLGDSANSDSLAISESMASDSAVFAAASASASLFSPDLPSSLSCDSLSVVTAPQTPSASTNLLAMQAVSSAAPGAAISWAQPRTAFLQALLEDVKRPKRVRGSFNAWRFGMAEECHGESSAGNVRGLPCNLKSKRDADTAFGTTALGVLHLLPRSSSSANLYTSESADTWHSLSGSGSPGGSDVASGGAGSGWFRTSSTSSLESFSNTPNSSSIIPSVPPPTPPVNNVSNGVRRCVHCKSTKTPQWRMGPAGPKTLCNACGVRFKKGKLCPEYRPANSPEYEESKHSNQHRKILAMRGSVAAIAS